ncbi:MAG: L28 family ribosomal protein [Microgenomates group bacterium]
MKNVCFNCGKGILMGRQHTHHRGVAGGRWKKRAPKTAKAFAPNLQKVRIMIGDVAKQVRLCTKCIKRVKKDIADGKKPSVTIISLGKTEKKAEVASKAPKAKVASKAKAKKTSVKSV